MILSLRQWRLARQHRDTRRQGPYGSFDKLNDNSLESLRGLIEQLHAGVDVADPTAEDRRSLCELHDEAALERLDLKPLAAEFARIAALKSKQDIRR